MDGHGYYGDKVSQYIKENFKETINKHLHELFDMYRRKDNSINMNIMTEKTITSYLSQSSFKKIREIYKSIDTQLSEQTYFSVNESGSTLVSLFTLGNTLICANTGDSRCILVKKNKYNNKLEIDQMSQDHKPNLVNERKRICKSGGEVVEYRRGGQRPKMYRVFKKNENYPGLAVSRSMGDSDAKDAGVISEPEIEKRTIDKSLLFAVLASDGLWDYLSNEEVMNIINDYYEVNDLKGASIDIVNRAKIMWNKFDTNHRDDISVCIIFFNKKQEDSKL